MQLPLELQLAIESLANETDIQSLRLAREAVSAEYREGASSHRAFGERAQLLSYLVTRFPATFAACLKVFQEIRLRAPDFSCRSLIDLGAGPGSASWAAKEAFPDLQKLHLVEREKSAIEIGKKLAQIGDDAWARAEWTSGSLSKDVVVPVADLAIFSYVLGEMELGQSLGVVERVWKSTSMMALIEPGTPRGYERLMAIRDWAIAQGIAIVAPCPHRLACPMRGKEWCHFAARVERTRLHRQLKGGSLGYEDEKFSYLVLAKPEINLDPIRGRLVHQPFKGSGHVKLPLCYLDGELNELVVTKKDKEFYRKARDAEWGDSV